MKAFTGGDKSCSKIDVPILARIYSRTKFIPDKKRIIDTVQPVEIPLRCWCQLEGTSRRNDLLQRPL